MLGTPAFWSSSYSLTIAGWNSIVLRGIQLEIIIKVLDSEGGPCGSLNKLFALTLSIPIWLVCGPDSGWIFESSQSIIAAIRTSTAIDNFNLSL